MEGLSQAVLAERRKDRVKTLLELLAAQPVASPFRLAMLTGAAGKISTAKTSAAPRLLYLDNAPTVLEKLGSESTPAVNVLVKALDARLA